MKYFNKKSKPNVAVLSSKNDLLVTTQIHAVFFDSLMYVELWNRICSMCFKISHTHKIQYYPQRENKSLLNF